MFPTSIVKDKISKSDLITEKFIILPGIPNHLFSYSAQLIAHGLGKCVIFRKFSTLEDFEQFSVRNSSKKEEIKFPLKNGSIFQISDLSDIGYKKVDRVWNPGEFSLYGDVVIIWQQGHSNPLRISMMGKKVESIEIVDSISRKGIAERNRVEISAINVDEEEEAPTHDLIIGNEEAEEGVDSQFILIDGVSIIEAENLGYFYIDLGLRSIPMANSQYTHIPSLVRLVSRYKEDGYSVRYLANDQDSFNRIDEDLRKLIQYESISHIPHLVSKGFLSVQSKELFLTDYEIRGEINLADEEVTGADSRNEISQKREILLKQEIFKKVVPGDYLVHEDHGVGKYQGIVEKLQGDYMEVAYAGRDRLYVPLHQAGKITKYIGASKPILTSLSGGIWRRIKRAADENAEELAKELIRIYAMRKIAREEKKDRDKIDQVKLERFIKAFQFSDTEDQVVATDQIISDLASGIPMDRVLVGDVGFGKTEVAFRAIYAIAEMGCQVAFLAPTTILVEQHVALMKKRFEGFGIKIASLSRFITNADRKEILDGLEKGGIDVVVGTHALLSDKLKFNKLGLIVVDEEQKFGVEQKEKLKNQRIDTHVLSITATPIPRTLNMSLSGLKDISVIATPPPGRKPIENHFSIFSWERIKRSLMVELKRGGQVYFLHNRVRNIQFYKEKLSELFPDKTVEIAHGQMEPGELSFIMGAFAAGDIDILVCTSIIENGIDLANVNTLIVNNANMFGLSQLYQIRGRVGRSTKQAYAYFLYKNLPGKSGQRLDALADSDQLGAGFMLSNRDLEIRGAGNLLGREQSGAINGIGFGMYINLLEQKIEELRE